MITLTARSLRATGGTTLGGQHLSPRTGRLIGPRRLSLLTPTRKGVYTAQVPAHAAAIITLPA
jgi:hypothetical protein